MGTKTFFFLSIVAWWLTACVNGSLLYEGKDGSINSISAPQIWYNGYWEQAGWINGTLVPSKSENISGSIILVSGVGAPYERYVMKYIKQGAVAIVFLRTIIGIPGQSMYQIDGSNQLAIDIPIAEIFQQQNGDLSNLPIEGIPAWLLPDQNEWKLANDQNGFQIFFCVFNSVLEVAIIIIGLKRLRAFWASDGFRFLSIGQLCVMTEMCGTVIRLMYTILDPFFSFRIMTWGISNVLLTLSFPFSFTCGILLTFFWAETLSTVNVNATPFISHFKKSCIVVIAILFLAEIITDIGRSFVAPGEFSESYVACAFYLISSIVLTICYDICAFNILKRIIKVKLHQTAVSRMAIRFVVSTLGYLGFIICLLLYCFYLNYPWPYKFVTNFLFLSINLAAIIQVYSFKCAPHTGQTSKTPSVNSNGNRSAVSSAAV